MQTFAAGVLYFLLVFGAGFVLGPVRILWAVPKIGERAAELLEAPLMLAITFAAARWIVRRLHLPAAARTRLGMGFLALGLMLAAEFAFVLRVRSLSPADYIQDRDPLSGTVYYASLVVFALMPYLLMRK